MGKSEKNKYAKLYEESPAFKLFVDKNAKTYNKTLEELWEDKIIQSYGDYVLSEENNTEVRSEIRQDCGC